MKPLSAASFPRLHDVFAGYLHEDYCEDYESPAAALRAFEAEASRDERRRFRDEMRRFLARTSALDFQDTKQLLAALGCRWTPPSRDALTALFEPFAE
jgi:hypothetical protein